MLAFAAMPEHIVMNQDYFIYLREIILFCTRIAATFFAAMRHAVQCFSRYSHVLIDLLGQTMMGTTAAFQQFLFMLICTIFESCIALNTPEAS